MTRRINLDNVFSIVNNNNSFTSIIINYDDVFFSIEDDWEKLCDVSQMPDYIKKDWVKYNRKTLNMITINRHIKYWVDKGQNSETEERTEILKKLKSIRRDFIIKGIFE